MEAIVDRSVSNSIVDVERREIEGSVTQGCVGVWLLPRVRREAIGRWL